MVTSEELKDHFGDKIEENVLLRDFTSFGVGGVADYFFRAGTIEQMVDAISFLSRQEIPYFVFGGGYNLVFSDMGFPGVVIKNEVKDIVFSQEKAEVIVSSGVPINQLLVEAASRDLGGLEFLFGIPGTIGGAVYGNAGAFGYSIGDFVKSVTIILPGNKAREAKIIRQNKGWLEFDYRTSKLKEFSKSHLSDNKPVILSLKIQLARSRKDVILHKMKENFSTKKRTQPLDGKNAGCFFKNPGIQKEESAGFLLDKSGAKHLKIGDAIVSKKHANFIINRKNATADDIRRLAGLMKDLVRAEYRVNLEEEVEYVGKW
ncbi:MAG: UDP-N-acetylmuramate dehydrogenase [Candidatus Berkelbacteria bacterium Athens1014_28]|uniref:UDP-N-acetylenolpyruvoylglucosamine reductase n=1 Tax=Candidatus Berkelbacteria bacterium Athens1014_28 TaxID=2017145 RepID=A0A554LQ48_9BACT|nr:MAG: UDP-N-acetylmuramate dehydrogenase [Candidatus Berkelbacteria bacterium Athens1014_28]